MTVRKQLSRVRLALVEAEQAGQRLDNFLQSLTRGVPGARLYRAIRKGEVRVNGGRAKPEYRLKAGDRVRIPPLAERAPAKVSGRHDFADATLYEDDRLLIINKPAGWAVHGGSGIARGLVEAIRAARNDLHYLQLAHRLDRDTSGLLLLAKKRSALNLIHESLRTRQLKKTYLALVPGTWPKRRTRIAAPLVRQVLSSGERRVRVQEDGKPSLTRFRLLQAFADCSLIEASPVTGRTHQIRVHAGHAGCPVLGDEKYGTGKSREVALKYGIKRLFLHAFSIELPELGEVRAELPEELESVLQQLGAMHIDLARQQQPLTSAAPASNIGT